MTISLWTLPVITLNFQNFHFPHCQFPLPSLQISEVLLQPPVRFCLLVQFGWGKKPRELTSQGCIFKNFLRLSRSSFDNSWFPQKMMIAKEILPPTVIPNCDWWWWLMMMMMMMMMMKMIYIYIWWYQMIHDFHFPWPVFNGSSREQWWTMSSGVSAVNTARSMLPRTDAASLLVLGRPQQGPLQVGGFRDSKWWFF